MSKWWDKATPWNTKNEKAEISAEQKKLDLEIAIAQKKAGIVTANDITVLATSASTKTYIILGVVLVLVVGIAVYFKFRKK